jgi:hypothetical protein
MRLVALFAILIAAVLPLPAASGIPRGMVEDDLYRVQWVGDPQISPDGTRVAFVRTIADTAENGYRSSIWIVPVEGGEARPLTSGDHDGSPRWSPDGQTLAFLRPGRDENGPQIWLLSMGGGEATQLTDLDGGAGAPLWSPGPSAPQRRSRRAPPRRAPFIPAAGKATPGSSPGRRFAPTGKGFSIPTATPTSG